MRGAAHRWVGVGLLAAVLVLAVLGPALAPFAADARVAPPFATPSDAHLLGADDLGRDLWSRLLAGARPTALVAGLAAVLAVGVGVAVAVGSAVGPPWLGRGLLAVTDVALALPSLPLVIVVAAVTGPGLAVQALVIGVVLWPRVARQLLPQVASLATRDHVVAAVALGGGPVHVARRHLLPAVAPLVATQAVLVVRTAIVLQASLTFLGLGDPDTATWGAMLGDAHRRGAFLTGSWVWWVVPPGLALAAAVLGAGLVAAEPTVPAPRRARPRTAGSSRLRRPAG